jgi:hypothetical protein
MVNKVTVVTVVTKANAVTIETGVTKSWAYGAGHICLLMRVPYRTGHTGFTMSACMQMWPYRDGHTGLSNSVTLVTTVTMKTW